MCPSVHHPPFLSSANRDVLSAHCDLSSRPSQKACRGPPTRGAGGCGTMGENRAPHLGLWQGEQTLSRKGTRSGAEAAQKTPLCGTLGRRETPLCSLGLTTDGDYVGSKLQRNTYSHLSGLRSALRRRRRWLRPGGWLPPAGGHLRLCFSQACSLCSVASEFLALNKHLWS